MARNGEANARCVTLGQFRAGLGEEEFNGPSLQGIQLAFAQKPLESFDIFSDDVVVLERHGANPDDHDCM